MRDKERSHEDVNAGIGIVREKVEDVHDVIDRPNATKATTTRSSMIDEKTNKDGVMAASIAVNGSGSTSTSTSTSNNTSRAVNAHVNAMRPGAVAVDGIHGRNGNYSNINESSLLVDVCEEVEVDGDAGQTRQEAINLEGELHDEEAIRRRVTERLEQRMQSVTIEATNVQKDEKEPTEVSKSSNNSNAGKKKNNAAMVLFGLGVVALIIVLAAVLPSSISSSNEGGNTPATTINDHDSNSGEDHDSSANPGSDTISDLQYLQELFMSVSSNDTALYEDESSPQYKAIDWLLYKDMFYPSNNQTIQSADPRMLTERYVLAVLYYATLTDPDSWVSAEYELLSDQSICEWHAPNDANIQDGIYCNDDQFADSIVLGESTFLKCI